MSIKKARNIAIIAHVDHGKTTLLDVLFRQTSAFGKREVVEERVMDSNPLEKERGITIQAKNASLNYNGHKINIIDTPGHADFGGEVERILNMVDGVLLLVDAFEGPMPQTRFVTRKALGMGLKPLVVINKVDRPGSRPDAVLDMVFDLFIECKATDQQLDFPHIYTSAKEGYARYELTDTNTDAIPLLDMILKEMPEPKGDVTAPFQMIVSDLHYDNYLGSLLVGRIHRGTIKTGDQIVRLLPDGTKKQVKIQNLYGFEGLLRKEIPSATAGDIILLSGIENGKIGETLADVNTPEALPIISIEEPTLSMNFMVNDSPYAGQDGKYVTSRQLRERLYKEALTNISMRVEDTDRMDEFKISGRGELHLGILIETMRREGFEFAVSRPKVVFKEINNHKFEPVEDLQLEIPEDCVGGVMDELGKRRADIKEMNVLTDKIKNIRATIPTRGLIGFRSLFLTLTKGEGIMYHSFFEYERYKGDTSNRQNGALVAMATGEAVPYGIWKLQDRGTFIIPPNVMVYEGMVVGINSRDQDMVVNVCTQKKMTNVRAAGKDEAVRIVPHKKLSLEQSLEFIEDDELVEITPLTIRIRKRVLNENERKRGERARQF